MNTQELGEFLRTRREAKGLSAIDVADRTKIHSRYIRAMEEGRFDLLPGIVYARAFVRHYARAVGEDADELVAQFNRAIELEGEPLSHPRSRRRSKRRGRRLSRIPWAWVVAVALLAALGFLVARAVDLTGGGPQPVAATVGPTQAPSFELRQDSLSPGPASEDRSDRESAAASPGQEEAGEGEEASESDEQSGAAGLSGFEEAAGDAGQAAVVPAAAQPPGVVLEVYVERASWFRVVADGTLVFEGIVGDARPAVWTAREELRVRYGRPEGVFVTLNGTYLGVAGTGVIERVYRSESAAGT